MRNRETYEYNLVCGEVLKVTEKAVLIEAETDAGETKQTWIPRSQIEDGEAVIEGDSDLYVKNWFCTLEGL